MYPTDEQLEYIKNFNIVNNPISELIDYIQDIWMYWPDYFRLTSTTLELMTGGWSGNESIISALEQNYLFWSVYWWKSERGGYYCFDLTRGIKRTKV